MKNRDGVYIQRRDSLGHRMRDKLGMVTGRSWHTDIDSEVLQENYKRVLQEKEHLSHLLRSHHGESQQLEANVQKLQARVHTAGQENAKLIEKMESHIAQRKKEIESRDACIERLESDLRALKNQPSVAPPAPKSRPIDSNAVTCAVALMAKVDTLVHEKEELQSMLVNLWSKVQKSVKVEAA